MHDSFSKLNLQRCDDPRGFNCSGKNNLYWVTALTEELGEIAGIVKKLDRGFNKRELAKMRKKFEKPKDDPGYFQIDENVLKLQWEMEKIQSLSKEMADVQTYLDLMASKNNINLEEATINKFNEVSTEMGLGNEYLYTEGKYNLPNQDSI